MPLLRASNLVSSLKSPPPPSPEVAISLSVARKYPLTQIGPIEENDEDK